MYTHVLHWIYTRVLTTWLSPFAINQEPEPRSLNRELDDLKVLDLQHHNGNENYVESRLNYGYSNIFWKLVYDDQEKSNWKNTTDCVW